MLRRLTAIAVVALSGAGALLAARAAEPVFNWSELPPLPPAEGQDAQPGLAGPFVGVANNGDLIVAGGANFPEAPPWEGGRKVWWDSVFLLPAGGAEWVTTPDLKLPRPLGYGVAITTADGVLCIGGCDADRCYADTFLLHRDPGSGKWTIRNLAPMPAPLAFMTGARVGDTVYVAGGQEGMTGDEARATANFFAYHIPSDTWSELAPFPGRPRIVPVSAAQTDGRESCFFLFSGRNVQPGQPAEILTDSWKYSPSKKAWVERAAVSTGPGEPSRSVMAGTAIDSGAYHILVFGGAEGKLFKELETLAAAGDKDREREILTTHPGFSRDILAYHAIADSWTRVGEIPEGSQVTTQAVKWGGGVVIPSGEIQPGIRTAKTWSVTTSVKRSFGWVNYTVLGVYLASLVWLGVVFSRRMHTTEDFFKAGGRIPWWAAGLSIFGTQLSALTFMSVPAKAFSTDWTPAVNMVGLVAVAPIVVCAFLPFFRRLNVTTAYEYLERRFNVFLRLVGSTLFVVFQIGRIGIVLFLPSLALSVVTGMEVHLCILLMGVLCIAYTVLGGIEAVIWTDVLQVVVLIGGALVCLLLIPFQSGGFANALEIAWQDNKFHMFDFHWSLKDPVVWVLVAGSLGLNLIPYGTDQAVIQRYLTTKDEKSAARGIWLGALMGVPSTILFFSIGTFLYVYFKANPAMADPTLADGDSVFPLYITTRLPAGVAGLVIAALFAASMSSLDSSMNSVSAAFTTDFYRRFKKSVTEKESLRVARLATVVVGVLGTGFALSMTMNPNLQNIWDFFNSWIGLTGGVLCGLFLLAIFVPRAGSLAATLALFGGAGVQAYLFLSKAPIHIWLYSITGILATLLFGLLFSFVTPGPDAQTRKLTYSGLKHWGK